jgi:TonB family protein
VPTHCVRAKYLAAGVAALSLISILPVARAEALRVTEADAKKAVIKKVAPEYPLLARQNHIVGKVEIEIAIDSTGSVASASVKQGNVVLGGAAMMAVRQWKFTPFSADGKPTDAVAILIFNFGP